MASLLNIILIILISLYFHQHALSMTYSNMQHRHKATSTITVDQSGRGNFTSVQDAINFIPLYNNHWIRIHVRAGIYNEKVIIPAEKPYIVLEGDGRKFTVIQAAKGGDLFNRSTFSLFAQHFVARNISFKNIQEKLTWAPAALISGDKAAFFECGFISVQDTLTDSQGRHYFESCYIQGAIDFIWGDGQSIYQDCTLNVTYKQRRESDIGYITAQARHSSESQSGFVFINCTVQGTIAGPTYLGRAYTQYSRVLFYKSRFDNLIASEGWVAWHSAGREKQVVFAEEDCSGPGANTTNRVSWMKRLSKEDVGSLVDVDRFINYDGWLNKLPRPLRIKY